MFDEAKKIYINSIGKRQFMASNGDLELYESFNVPAGLEEQWKIELIDNLTKKFKTGEESYYTFRTIIRAANGTEKIINDIIDVFFERELDSLTTMMILEEVLNICTEKNLDLNKYKVLALDSLAKLKTQAESNSLTFENEYYATGMYSENELLIPRIEECIKIWNGYRGEKNGTNDI